MYEVIYFSRGGSTRKLAMTIAEELAVKPQFVRKVDGLAEGADVFLGSGLYFMRPAKLIRDFIRNNDFRGRKVALFGTSASAKGIEIMGMESLLKRRGAVITGKFYTAGNFSLRLPKLGTNANRRFGVRKGRPTQEDLEKARRFAQLVAEGTPARNGIKLGEFRERSLSAEEI